MNDNISIYLKITALTILLIFPLYFSISYTYIGIGYIIITVFMVIILSYQIYLLKGKYSNSIILVVNIVFLFFIIFYQAPKVHKYEVKKENILNDFYKINSLNVSEMHIFANYHKKILIRDITIIRKFVSALGKCKKTDVEKTRMQDYYLISFFNLDGSVYTVEYGKRKKSKKYRTTNYLEIIDQAKTDAFKIRPNSPSHIDGFICNDLMLLLENYVDKYLTDETQGIIFID